MIVQDYKNLSDLKKSDLVQQRFVQMQQYSFGSKETTELDPRYKSDFDFISSYAKKKKQSLDETQNLFPYLRKLSDQ